MNLEKNIKPILGLLLFIFGFLYFFAVLIIEKKSNLIIIGAINSLLSMSFGYYFGSSAGSAKKDNLINNLKTKENNESNTI